MNVYSVTEFFNELDLLELRLETMSPYVDYFVISESTKTHSGIDKPLYYEHNKDRFKKFHKQIIHQIITDSPGSLFELKTMRWNSHLHHRAIRNVLSATWFDLILNSFLRDDYEKESLIVPLQYCWGDDIILFGDLDEIVRPESLRQMLDNFDPNTVYNFRNDMFYYYLNNQKVNEPWVGTLALTWDKFLKENHALCRLRTHRQGEFVENGGWHFTYMGGPDKVRQKIMSWGEQSLNVEAVRNNVEYNVKNFLTTGRDVFFRPSDFRLRDINDGTFPQYAVEHQDDIYKDYIIKP